MSRYLAIIGSLLLSTSILAQDKLSKGTYTGHDIDNGFCSLKLTKLEDNSYHAKLHSEDLPEIVLAKLNKKLLQGTSKDEQYTLTATMHSSPLYSVKIMSYQLMDNETGEKYRCKIDNRLKPFKSDGCSMSPDGNFTFESISNMSDGEWVHCCVIHDMAYYKGGPKTERLEADLALKQCVADSGHPKYAAVVYSGVRSGGMALLPTSWRWGYGWDNNNYHRILSEEENEVVENYLSDIDPYNIEIDKEYFRPTPGAASILFLPYILSN